MGGKTDALGIPRWTGTQGWGEVIGLFHSPGESFDRLLQRGLWGPAYVITVVVTLLTFVVMYPHMLSSIQGQMAPAMPNDTVEATMEIYRVAILIGGIIGSVIGPIISALLLAGVYFILGVAIGTPASFHTYFVIACCARLPNLVGSLVNSLFVVMGLTVVERPLSFSPVVFFSDLAPGSIPHSLLGRLDPFVIYGIVLAVYGIAWAHKRPPLRLTWVGVVLLFLSLAIAATSGLITSAFNAG